MARVPPNNYFGQPGAPARGPGGRPKQNQNLVLLCRQHTELAVAVLVTVAQDFNETGSARVAAARELLDRGWGKAPQNVVIEGSVNVKKLDDAELDTALRDELARYIGIDAEGEPFAQVQGKLN